MSTRSAADARLLFVLSSDFGELGNAMHLLYGQPMADRTTLLVPPRLAVAGSANLPGRFVAYRSAQDVQDALDREQPDVVLLFSGYLYVIDGTLDAASADRMLRDVVRRVPHIVVSDPFLGVQGDPTRSRRFSEHHASLQAASAVIGDAIHFYPVYCRGLTPRLQQRSVSAFNPTFVRPAGDHDPFWLFILSRSDYRVRIDVDGRGPFLERLHHRLLDAAASGRRVVFIAPPDCAAALREKLGDRDDIAILDFCSYDRFTALLLTAEYVFYWNMFSNSTVLRYGSGQPVFFFDSGHLALTRVLHDAAIDNYFNGWRPVCLDDRQPLVPAMLRTVERLSRSGSQSVHDHVRRSPTPEEMIARVLAMPPMSGGDRTVSPRNIEST